MAIDVFHRTSISLNFLAVMLDYLLILRHQSDFVQSPHIPERS